MSCVKLEKQALKGACFFVLSRTTFNQLVLMNSKHLVLKMIHIGQASKRLIFLAVFALLAACGRNGDAFTALIPSDSGINEHTPVLLNGIEVGHLEKLRIQTAEKGMVYATILLHPNIHLAKDAHFEICNAGTITENKFIAASKSVSSQYLGSNDTINIGPCTAEKRELIDSTSVLLLDSLIRHTKRLLNNRNIKQRVEPKEPVKAQ